MPIISQLIYFNYNQLEPQLFSQINKVRTNPFSYINKVNNDIDSINYLNTVSKTKTLNYSYDLSNLANQIILEQANSGYVGHPSENNRYANYNSISENLVYGLNDASNIISTLIIDLNNPDKGHRYSLFDNQYKYVGISCGLHPIYKIVCAIIYSN